MASGDPSPDSVILWTRVTPTDAAKPGSGVGPAVDVVWEVAADPAFATVLRSGTVRTGPERDHTVKVDVGGLRSNTDHWYRFRLDGAASPAGRTRTLPAPGTTLASMRLGVVTCAEWEFGFFGAYRHLAARDDVAAVLHLGDYIYEFGLGYGPRDTPGSDFGRVHQPAARDRLARRLPHPLRAVPHRRRASGAACRPPDDRDVGRPRDRQRLVA